jgi:hypothetical protein
MQATNLADLQKTIFTPRRIRREDQSGTVWAVQIGIAVQSEMNDLCAV